MTCRKGRKAMQPVACPRILGLLRLGTSFALRATVPSARNDDLARHCEALKILVAQCATGICSAEACFRGAASQLGMAAAIGLLSVGLAACAYQR